MTRPTMEMHAEAVCPLDINRFLDALAAVESGGNINAVGKRGELGAWQMTREAWQLTTLQWDFSYACDPIIGRAMAAKRCVMLIDWLKAAGARHDAYGLAFAWNRGLHGAIESRPDAHPADHATRVANLYAEGAK